MKNSKLENKSSESVAPTGERSTKERIFDHAVDLFSQKGFHAVSVRELTRAVGIKESSLYNHFQSKDEILDAIFDYFEKELVRRAFPVEELAEDDFTEVDPEELFKRNLLRFRQTLTPTFIKIWRIVMMEQFREQRARDFLLHEIIRRPALFYEKVFEKMMAAGRIKGVDVKILADMFNYIMFAISVEINMLSFDNNHADVEVVVQKRVDILEYFFSTIKV